MRTASRRLFALKLLPAQPADHFRRGRFLANDEAQPVAHPAVYRASGDKGQSQALKAKHPKPSNAISLHPPPRLPVLHPRLRKKVSGPLAVTPH